MSNEQATELELTRTLEEQKLWTEELIKAKTEGRAPVPLDRIKSRQTYSEMYDEGVPFMKVRANPRYGQKPFVQFIIPDLFKVGTLLKDVEANVEGVPGGKRETITIMVDGNNEHGEKGTSYARQIEEVVV